MYKFVDGECCVEVSWTAKGETTSVFSNLPCYAEEVQNSVAANWSGMQVIGRTGQLFSYTGASDVSCSFTLKLHRELCLTENNPKVGSRSNMKTIDQIIAIIKSGCYPKYGSNTLRPPRTTFKFGDFWITGKLTSVSDSWEGPIIGKKYAMCTLSIQMESAATRIVDAEDIYGGTTMHSVRGHYVEG